MHIVTQYLPLLFASLLGSVVAAPAELLTTRQSLPTTENGLSEACKNVTIIYARGTNEAGNVGEIGGPAWIDKLRTGLGTTVVTAQGVDYVADVSQYISHSYTSDVHHE